MNKPLYLGLSILELSILLMYEFWYDYVKPAFGIKPQLCYIDTDSFILYIKPMIFTKILQKMLKQDLALQIINQNAIPLKGCHQKGKIKSNWIIVR